MKGRCPVAKGKSGGNSIKAATNGHHHTNGGTKPDGGYIMGKGGTAGQTSASKVPGRTQIGKQGHVNFASKKPVGGGSMY
jgi:hypothetical protein